MNAIIKLEIIGDNFHAYLHELDRNRIKNIQIREMCKAMKFGKPRFYPSVFLLHSGTRNRVERIMKDYSHAKNIGERGVFEWYSLEPGLYEINECIALGVMHTKRILVDNDGATSEVDLD